MSQDHLNEVQETIDAIRGLRSLLKPGSAGGYGLTLAEAAKALGVSQATVRNWTGTYHAKEDVFLGGRRLPTGARDAGVKRFVARKFAAWRKDYVRRNPDSEAAKEAAR